MGENLKSLLKKGQITLLTLAALGFSAQAGQAEVLREDLPMARGACVGSDKLLEVLPPIPISKWEERDNNGLKPRGIALAIHGLVMHGRVYDAMARELAKKGYIVFAPDLRGYGRWNAFEPDSPASGQERVDYEKSFQDLKVLVRSLKGHYGQLPLFVIGESLGAGFSIRLAEELPGQIDGIVLSSPALKRRLYMEPEMVKGMAQLVTNPSKELNLVPYIKKFASEDPQIVCDALKDPYVRKSLNCFDLCKTDLLIRSNFRHVYGVPESMPVLVIQGDKDRMLRSQAVTTLMARLRSRDQTVRWLPGKGHLLIETSHIEPITMKTIQNWLDEHSQEPRVAIGKN
jgi:alpha-beta hydrolase superfamily lysophospholipase